MSFFTKNIFFIGIFFFLGIGYTSCSKEGHSQYQAACEKLGLTTFQEQKSLLDIFSIAGYLEQQELWSAIYRSQVFDNPTEVFKEVASVLYDESGKLVQTDFIVKHLFNRSLNVDLIAQLILYIAQTAFDRKKGQELLELHEKSWMEEYRDEYMTAAQALGLVDSIVPDMNISYDLVLVLGASYSGLYPRLLELNYYVQNGLQYDYIFVLAGQRELWAELDGLGSGTRYLFEKAKQKGVSLDAVRKECKNISSDDKIENGKKYIMELADKNNVPYDHENPIVIRNNRSYLNALNPNEKVTETMMSIDALRDFSFKTLDLIDTENYSNGERPDTVSTARKVADEFVRNMSSDKKQVAILVVSSNPYIRRQSLAVQREFNGVLLDYQKSDVTIELYGVGPRSNAQVARTHSSVGSLLSELFKDAYPEVNIDHLSFQTRDNSLKVPELSI